MKTALKRKTTLFTATVTAVLLISVAPLFSKTEESPAPNPPTAEIGIDANLLTGADTLSLAPLAAGTEWLYHKTADSKHPNSMEQRQLWFLNRARSNPTAEGIWLATESNSDVSGGRDFFEVDLTKLQVEFAAISPMPPAAFDRRLYEAAKVHSEDLIARDAQDHLNQLPKVTDAGFSYLAASGVVFSYSRSGLHAHAAFNIDWGYELDGMQTGRGHRVALMSDQKEYTNVGFASILVSEEGKNVGPYVTTGNFAKAASVADHFNAFIVGTVWLDSNTNGWYDDGEGLAGVRVTPSLGTYYAVTADSGGYAIPITATGAVTISFSGGSLATSENMATTLGAASKLVDFIPRKESVELSGGAFSWDMFLPAITSHHKALPSVDDCNGESGGRAYLDTCNTCVSGSTGKNPCTQDCNGIWGGTALLDTCGVCEGNDQTCKFTFTRSASSYTVTDSKTGLIWQDSGLAFADRDAGIAYCQAKSLDGFGDWRLPTLAELQDFFKRVEADPDFDLNYWGTFSRCTASVAIGGYVKTPYGAEYYGGQTGDTINFSGGAAARCVR